jgi:diguanylate cyclase (GGDEF)-like protein
LDDTDLLPKGSVGDVSSGWLPVAAPAADLPAALTGTVPPDTILEALEDLEEAAGRYTDWVCRVESGLIRRLNREMTADDPPPCFDLPSWREGAYQTVLKDNALLAGIDDRLQRLDRAADRLAVAVSREGRLGSDEFSGFVEEAAAVARDLRRLIGDLWNRLANIDPLTGLGNRPAMLRRLNIESERHARTRQPCCIAILDLDGFKPINDTLGHGAGDAVLRSLGGLLAASLRPYDAVFRFGGDEFVLCLPNTDPRTAWAIAERLRLRVADWSIPTKHNQPMQVTVSIGLSALSGDQSVETALEAADQALYAAKRNGRNTLVVQCG